uniref:Pilus assembly protein n=1 Tax=Desulfobacca acetoxidans TaxID=60893 RepID=A0A7C3Z726_9BACT
MFLTRLSNPKSRREKGNITIEMALVMPLFLFLMAGIIDLGLLFWEKHVITNATREGARAAAKAKDTGTAVVAQLTKTQVRQVVQDYVNQFNLKALDGSPLVLSDANFSYSWETTPSGQVLHVSLTQIPYKMMLLPNFSTFFGGTRTPGDEAFYLTAQTSMAAEWNNPPSP